MDLTKPIPVRLPPELIDRLDAVAKKLGNTRAGVIRFLIETWVDEFEDRGRAMLPDTWKDVLVSFDGRRGRYERARGDGQASASVRPAMNDAPAPAASSGLPSDEAGAVTRVLAEVKSPPVVYGRKRRAG